MNQENLPIDPTTLTDRELLELVYKMLCNGYSALTQLGDMVNHNPLLKGLMRSGK